MNRLRRALALENRVLESTAVAIAAFLLGSAARADWELLRRVLGPLLDR